MTPTPSPGADAQFVYQLKISLKRARPPIWRRVVVPAESTNDDLHRMIMAVFAWGGRHLHEFDFARLDRFEAVLSRMHRGLLPFRPGKTLDSKGAGPGSKFDYVYDFGDWWEHEIVVERVEAGDRNVRYPVCTGGKRAAPPDDCGGLDGYYDLLELLTGPDSTEREGFVTWLDGRTIDPEYFSATEADARLEPIRRRFERRRAKTRGEPAGPRPSSERR